MTKVISKPKASAKGRSNMKTRKTDFFTTSLISYIKGFLISEGVLEKNIEKGFTSYFYKSSAKRKGKVFNREFLKDIYNVMTSVVIRDSVVCVDTDDYQYYLRQFSELSEQVGLPAVISMMVKYKSEYISWVNLAKVCKFFAGVNSFTLAALKNSFYPVLRNHLSQVISGEVAIDTDNGPMAAYQLANWLAKAPSQGSSATYFYNKFMFYLPGFKVITNG